MTVYAVNLNVIAVVVQFRENLYGHSWLSGTGQAQGLAPTSKTVKNQTEALGVLRNELITGRAHYWESLEQSTMWYDSIEF
jgi:hypothetical protein